MRTSIRIKFRGNTWTFKVVDRIEEEDKSLGLTDHQTKTVFLRKGWGKDKRTTITHELVHVMQREYGFYQVEFDAEVIADFIATYLDEIYITTNKIYNALKQSLNSSSSFD